MDRMIRLDNKFIYKDKSKYYLTEITNLSEWKDMSDSDKKKAKGKDVTSKVKRLLKKYKTKGNINIKTKPSKKKIKKKTKKKSKKVGG